MNRKDLLGNILLAMGLITKTQLDEALAEQRKTKEFIGTVLIRKGLITQKTLLDALSYQFDIPVKNLKYEYIDWKFVSQFNPSLILDFGCIPLKKDETSLTVVITNPLDVWSMIEAEKVAGDLKLELVLISDEDMKDIVERYKQYLRGQFLE
ncbi:MAG: hypothetical protein JW800_07360 [Candidatus Omnitrophica bacterium]|nr:hypothetical protein [Candidatus Omnitrophota bacterium]